MAELTTKQKQFKNIDELYNYADNRNESLEVTDFDHKTAYELEHRDGSKFFITNALLELVRYTKGSIDETVYIVYSEHHQPLSYMESDLKSEPRLVKLIKGNLYAEFRCKCCNKQTLQQVVGDTSDENFKIQDVIRKLITDVCKKCKKCTVWEVVAYLGLNKK